jgi:Tol biopolymer transport system component
MMRRPLTRLAMIGLGVSFVWAAVVVGTVTAAETLARSPQLAYVSKHTGAVWEIHLLDLWTGREINFTRHNGRARSPAWSPDGTTLVYASDVNGDQELYAHPIDGRRRRLTRSAGDDSFPSFSPDGATIAFASNRAGDWSIYTMDAACLVAPETCEDTVRLAIDHRLAESAPVWSPDGEEIAYYVAASQILNGEIYIAPRGCMEQPGGCRRLARNLSQHGAEDWHPAWSPDGSALAFTSLRSGSQNTYLLDMTQAGAQPELLIDARSYYWDVVWSPDGETIAFTSVYAGGLNSEIFVMDAGCAGRMSAPECAGTLRRLTAGIFDNWSPVWRP